jgi:hypothetical protein
MFGRPGSIAGSFGVVSDIVADDHGRLLVADKLRWVVMVFDSDHRFLTEFGAGENGRAWLSRPAGLALGNDGKIYVTQAGKKGVAVYRMSNGGEMIRSGAGPQTGGGAASGRAVGNQPGHFAAEDHSAVGETNMPPAGPTNRVSVRPTDPAGPRITGMPEAQGGNEQ